MAHNKRYYVRADTGRGGVVLAYGVYDCIGGLESEHHRFDVTEKQSAAVALYQANLLRDDLNNGVE